MQALSQNEKRKESNNDSDELLEAWKWQSMQMRFRSRIEDHIKFSESTKIDLFKFIDKFNN
jgi:hypothetical protein